MTAGRNEVEGRKEGKKMNEGRKMKDARKTSNPRTFPHSLVLLNFLLSFNFLHAKGDGPREEAVDGNLKVRAPPSSFLPTPFLLQLYVR